VRDVTNCSSAVRTALVASCVQLRLLRHGVHRHVNAMHVDSVCCRGCHMSDAECADDDGAIPNCEVVVVV
jgi:hypothetical protein